MKWMLFLHKMENRNLGNLTKYRNLQKMENRNLQIINCDIGRDVINSPPAQNEYRNLQIYFKKSQLSQLSQKSQISQFMLSHSEYYATNIKYLERISPILSWFGPCQITNQNTQSSNDQRF